MGLDAAPLWLCFVPQIVSVVGDSFGQRCVRVFHGHSLRRFIIALTAVSAIQIFLILSILQLALPKVTTMIYAKNHTAGTSYDWCSLPENKDSDHCYSQGPLMLWKSVGQCPLLLVDSAVNIFYYLGEAVLYNQSIGVLLLVLAALTSSFIVSPLQHIFQLPDAKSAPVVPIIFGMCGSILCLIERDPKSHHHHHHHHQHGTTQPTNATLEDRQQHDMGIQSKEAPRVVAKKINFDDITSEEERKKSSTSSSSSSCASSPQMQDECQQFPSPTMPFVNGGKRIEEKEEAEIEKGARNFQQGKGERLHEEEHEGTGLLATSAEGTDATTTPHEAELLRLIHQEDNALKAGEADASPGRKCWLTTQLYAHYFKKHLPLFGPFLMLSFTYAMYFVIMDFYNEKCRMNLWGYNAYDQISTPFALYLVFLVVDNIGCLRRNLTPNDEVQETFWEAIKAAFHQLFSNKCEGLINMFFYRLFINARAIAYTYIVTQYDLAVSYLQLTLIRVALSWIVSLLLVLVVPKFIRVESLEQRKLKDPVNISLKLIGTTLIVVSLVIIHNSATK